MGKDDTKAAVERTPAERAPVDNAPMEKTPRKKAPAKQARPAPKIATPWGAATMVEELVVNQRAAERRFASLVQLLELPGGERLVRFAYSTGGTARRGPVTLRTRDLDRLRTSLADRPSLAATLGALDVPADGAA